MASITLAVSDELKNELKRLSWINWSEIAREETLKKIIFERYIKTREISDVDWEFCEKIDWHPVDELPLKEEHIKEINRRRKGPFVKLNSLSGIFKD
ncbi:hypothetical protein JW930_01025 [Candidatus Woesearchaeota archaeon]|nr:hypothetical protein [Candidatus Woesearchaeota archaeon]